MGRESEFHGPFPTSFDKKDELIWDPDTLLYFRQMSQLAQQTAPDLVMLEFGEDRLEVESKILSDQGPKIIELIQFGRQIGVRSSFATVALERGMKRAIGNRLPEEQVHDITQRRVKTFFRQIGENLAA